MKKFYVVLTAVLFIFSLSFISCQKSDFGPEMSEEGKPGSPISDIGWVTKADVAAAEPWIHEVQKNYDQWGNHVSTYDLGQWFIVYIHRYNGMDNNGRNKISVQTYPMYVSPETYKSLKSYFFDKSVAKVQIYGCWAPDGTAKDTIGDFLK